MFWIIDINYKRYCYMGYTLILSEDETDEKLRE